jgi:hypothetical protein
VLKLVETQYAGEIDEVGLTLACYVYSQVALALPGRVDGPMQPSVIALLVSTVYLVAHH